MKKTNIIIVGGGTSGWLSAVYLQHAFALRKRTVDVTLIESPDIGIIGVGEATIPNLCKTLSILGIDEMQFMRASSATFKQAIKFCNWRHDPRTDENEHYFHTFEPPHLVHGHDLPPLWQAYQENGGSLTLAEAASPQPLFCEQSLAPKSPASRTSERHVGYAYHLDAVKLGAFLRHIAIHQGATHIQDTVRHVEVGENGNIASLATKDHGQITGDLFIDCTGFTGLLMSKALKEPFISFGDRLLCDRAMMMQIPYQSDQGDITPYTTSTAQSAGWTWNIQLANRSGNGYVYSSAFISDDEAEHEFRKHLGPAAHRREVRKLRMRIGRHEKSWVGNCIAIGLAGGFVEPLESTGIYLVERALELLTDNLPKTFDDPVAAQSFNAAMASEYDDIVDFIVLHYCLTEREDSAFWKANKFDAVIPDSLSQRLEIWRHRFPHDVLDRIPNTPFSPHNWTYILAGMGRLPTPTAPLPENVTQNGLKSFFDHRQQTWRQAASTLSNHRECINRIHGHLHTRRSA